MGKLTLVGETPKADKLEDFRQYLANFSKDVQDQVNGNLLFVDNIRCSIVDVDFTAANTDKTFRHGLKTVPVGYWLIKTNAAATLYTGSLAADTQTITLKSSAIATTKVMVF